MLKKHPAPQNPMENGIQPNEKVEAVDNWNYFNLILDAEGNGKIFWQSLDSRLSDILGISQSGISKLEQYASQFQRFNTEENDYPQIIMENYLLTCKDGERREIDMDLILGSSPSTGDANHSDPPFRHLHFIYEPGVAFNGQKTVMFNVSDHTDLMAKYRQAKYMIGYTRSIIDVLAHQYKNSLGTISGAVELMKGNSDFMDDPSNLKLMEMIARSVDNLSTLSNTYLQYSKMEEGRLPFNPSFVKFRHRVVGEAYSNFEHTIRSRRKAFLYDDVSDDHGNDITVFCDVSNMVILYENLIQNALKYAPDGNVMVCTHEMKDDGHQFTFFNDGSMIPESAYESIFERHYRIKSDDPHHESKGHGIGLWFCKKIVEMHGGKMWVESGVEDGIKQTYFKFTLPSKPLPEYEFIGK